ncbi:MAG: hypothetical protein ACR2PZ_27245 [Pseudomonadales bacterium]
MHSTHNPEQYLQQAYLGEIGGEATFRSLADALPERADALNLLAEVERLTADYLRTHLLTQISTETVDEHRAEAVNRVTDIGKLSWSGVIDFAIPIVDEALTTFKAAEQQAPSELLGVYRMYTAHEQALAEYFRLERDGSDGTHVLEKYLDRVRPTIPG